MAKKDYDKRHGKELNQRGRKVGTIIDEARRKAAAIAASTGYDGEGDFFFDDYAPARKRMETLMRDTASRLTANITDGITAEWQLSALKMSAIVEYVSRHVKIPGKLAEKWTDSLSGERDDFLSRKVMTTSLSTGRPREMTLSERVWNLSGQFKQEIELAVEEGMEEGMSAADLSRKVRKYLNEPEKLFRRVRMRTGTDEDGKPVYSGALRLSKAAQAYHPGVGVYRSSYKNALRMTSTEINTAYRTADYLRWKSMPFILGIEVRITSSRHVPDICDDLKGKYPKDFKFTGWHPWCRCYAVPILPSVEEFKDWDGKSEFEGEETDVPDGFKSWVGKNSERIASARTLPPFLKDNEKYWKGKERKWREKVENVIAESRKRFESYDREIWSGKRYFDEKTGGYYVSHKEHKFSQAGGGGAAEIKVAETLAKQGMHIEFLSEGSNGKAADMLFDGQTWDVKYIEKANVNTIRKTLKNARKADNAIYIWDETDKLKDLRSAYRSEIKWLGQKGKLAIMPSVYVLNGSKLICLWKNPKK